MRAALVLAAGLAMCSAAAASTRLDDSLSPRQRVETTTRWLYDGVGDWTEDQMNALVAEVHAMEFRLRTAPYVGKTAEIYLSIPQNVSGLRVPTAMRVEWTTRGLFAPGSVTPGNRALVYRGKITEPVMSDYFDFRIFLDARTSERGIEFDPVFEIDLVAP
ncbi:MAG TPA: hypothetical protein VEG27_08395 [Usitatibacter sp.]|nr:hypothetical protein [Usitatibacter sp.]